VDLVWGRRSKKEGISFSVDQRRTQMRTLTRREGAHLSVLFLVTTTAVTWDVAELLSVCSSPSWSPLRRKGWRRDRRSPSLAMIYLRRVGRSRHARAAESSTAEAQRHSWLAWGCAWVGPRRGAAQRRRVHPSVGACAGEGAHGDTNVLLPSLLCGEARMRREEARKEMVS
jgi:hypothetical protein